MTGSWKTTVAGIVALVGGGLCQFFPEYARYGQFMVYLGSGLGLLFARDNDKSSEAVGASGKG